MRLQRLLLGLVLGLAAGAAAAEAGPALRWRGGAAPLGLQPASADAAAVPCGPLSLSCASEAVLPLYSSGTASRRLDMHLGSAPAGSDRAAPHGLSLSLVGKAGVAADLGVYGRVGTTLGRASALAGGTGAEGISYGVGLRWDFSRRASAVLGVDSYDVRGVTGESRDVRATSLGLQWRY